MYSDKSIIVPPPLKLSYLLSRSEFKESVSGLFYLLAVWVCWLYMFFLCSFSVYICVCCTVCLGGESRSALHVAVLHLCSSGSWALWKTGLVCVCARACMCVRVWTHGHVSVCMQLKWCVCSSWHCELSLFDYVTCIHFVVLKILCQFRIRSNLHTILFLFSDVLFFPRSRPPTLTFFFFWFSFRVFGWEPVWRS